MRRNAGLGLLLLAIAGVAAALPPAVEKRWPALSEAQRQLLQTRNARLSAMAPAQRDLLRQRIAIWHGLPIEQRRARREAWQAWQALPIEQRARLHTTAARFVAMAPEARQVLRAEFDALDASEQRGWLLGPALGRDYPRLQPLFAQVPQTQRDPLLALLRAMTPAERADLAVLAQRTPPQQRDALRRALLAAPRAQLGAWLRQQLDL